MRALVIGAAVCALGELGRADAGTTHALAWTRAPGAEGCMDGAELAARVEERLGRTLFAPSNAAVTIDASVRPGARGWDVAIAVRGADGTDLGRRELSDPSADCRALDDELVLVIALIVDPDAAVAGQAAAPPPSDPPPPAPPPETPPATQRSGGEPWQLSVGATAAVATGLMPGAAFGASLRLSIDPPALPEIHLRGSIWLDDELRDGMSGSRFQLVTGGVGACFPVWRSAVCGGVELGRMTATGFGFDRNRTVAGLVAHGVVEVQYAFPISTRVAFTARLAGWISLFRPEFVVDDGGDPYRLYQPSMLAVITELGATMRF